MGIGSRHAIFLRACSPNAAKAAMPITRGGGRVALFD
jgi:hypothetical protein